MMSTETQYKPPGRLIVSNASIKCSSIAYTEFAKGKAMSKPVKKHLRVTTAVVCAAALAMSLHFLWPTSVQSADIQHKSHSLVAEQQAVLAYFPASTTLWPH
jgi:hypothetical protein